EANILTTTGALQVLQQLGMSLAKFRLLYALADQGLPVHGPGAESELINGVNHVVTVEGDHSGTQRIQQITLLKLQKLQFLVIVRFSRCHEVLLGFAPAMGTRLRIFRTAEDAPARVEGYK